MDSPNPAQNSILLLSGGLDSTVNAALAVRDSAAETCRCVALTFDYGQRAARREIEAARAICGHLGIQQETIELPWLARLTRTALVSDAAEVPRPSEADLDDAAASTASADAVWVPNRNGVFLNIAAAWAESVGAERVIAGFNAEEAATFPDNSVDFLDATNGALRYSTRGTVRVESLTAALTKTEIFQRAREVEAPIWLSWSCYFGDSAPCGECESCRRFRRGLRDSGCGKWFEERGGRR